MAIAVVAGAIANKPLNGGESWVRLSWVLGLRRLGFDVYFFERIDPAGCVDAAGRAAPLERSANLAQLERAVAEFGMEGRVGLLGPAGERLRGLGVQALRALAAEADVLFDLSGNLGGLDVSGLRRRGTRVFVDLDPGFTQAWQADASLCYDISGYDRHVTVGLNVGSGGCPIPSAGLEWIPTLPPVVLDEWASPPAPAATATGPFRFTTVSSWRTHGPVAIGGRVLGLKHHALRELIDLPRQVPDAEFELALDIDRADARDRDALIAHGWNLVRARHRTSTPASFRQYVRGSCGEFSAAQPAYVATSSGWFSDRTAAYLAAGRPALVQDTGIPDGLADSEGLLTFASASEAVARVRRLVAEPLVHAEAARRFAESHLGSDRVLGGLLERLGAGA